MIHIRLQGPYVLQPHDDIALLYSQANAHKPGLFLWAFDHNRVNRINYVGVANESIANDNLSLSAKTILGERALYDLEKLDSGLLDVVANSSTDIARKCALSENAFSQLSRLRVFYANAEQSDDPLELVRFGIIRKLLDFGDIPRGWLDPALHEPGPAPENYGNRNITVRFHRPVFMASLPDEMYL